MKIVRAFMRIPRDISDPEVSENWRLRMDSLLAASEIDLNEFILDAILAITVRSGKTIEEVISIISEACALEGTDAVLGIIQDRWNYILAALGEHMDTAEARQRLADSARRANWEA